MRFRAHFLKTVHAHINNISFSKPNVLLLVCFETAVKWPTKYYICICACISILLRVVRNKNLLFSKNSRCDIINMLFAYSKFESIEIRACSENKHAPIYTNTLTHHILNHFNQSGRHSAPGGLWVDCRERGKNMYRLYFSNILCARCVGIL